MKEKLFVCAAAAVWVTAVALSAAGPARDGRDDRDKKEAKNEKEFKESDDESRIRRGFEIAPVPLNMAGKNPSLVGLGSYIVNATADCNGCHSGPAGEYADGGDPFQGQPAVVQQSAYLAGGTPNFGPIFLPRNLTPDKTGLPEGGASFEEFRSIMRTGVDPDQAHPQFGPFLQVMPWPTFRNMTDRDLRAIYEYLSAIPCLEGDPGLPNPRPIGTRCQ